MCDVVNKTRVSGLAAWHDAEFDTKLGTFEQWPESEVDHSHPVPNLGMSGALSLLPHTLSKLVKEKILPYFVIMFLWKRTIYVIVKNIS